MKTYAIGTIDLETDPFDGRTCQRVEPFVWGAVTGRGFCYGWREGGEDCIDDLVQWMLSVSEPTIFYAHNGGRFDFIFMRKHIRADAKIMDGRIVEARVGHHLIRDSYAIMPEALDEIGDKVRIDYSKLRRAVRHLHEREIVRYLEADCRELFRLVLQFRESFGPRLTLASVARSLMLDHYKRDADMRIESMGLDDDTMFRRWYFGGRCQALERGIILDRWKQIDVRSMYPFVMSSFIHPVGVAYARQRDLDDRTDFAVVDATARGCFPVRGERGRLQYPWGRMNWRVTGHELRAALDLGLVAVHRVLEAWRFLSRGNFGSFIRPRYADRRAAEAAGDAELAMHCKLVMNALSGRFALDPGKINEWQVLDAGVKPEEAGLDEPQRWYIAALSGDAAFWYRLAPDRVRERALGNIATAASITGAARAVLMRALAAAERPVYCDTDAIICREADVTMGDDLGDWRVETEADEAAIVARKTYALFVAGWPVRQASKGITVSADVIRQAAQGRTIWYSAPAPTMGLDGSQVYKRHMIKASEG